MFSEGLTKNLLSLFNSCAFIIDNKNNIAEEVYYESELIGKNISFTDLGHLLAEKYNLVDIFYDKIDRFMSNLKIDEGNFFIILDYETNEGAKIPFILRGYKFEEYKYLFAFYPFETRKYEIDELTKTVSRNYFKAEITECIEKNISFTLMYFALDDYEGLRKKYGNMYCDIFVIETVSAIKNIIKNSGIISRIGFSQFAILLKVDNDYDIVHGKVSEIRQSVNNLNIHSVRKIDIHSSIGCSSFPKDGNDLPTIIKKAEIAFERTIFKGGNNFVIYTEEKCGQVPPDYRIKYFNNTTQFSVQNATYNIMSGVIEILNRESEFISNINDALSLIGNFFLLDRVNYTTLSDKIDIQTWYNPNNVVPIPSGTITSEIFNTYIEISDSSGMLKYNQVDSNKTSPVYKMLHSIGTTSTLAFILEYKEKVLGIVSYDMCSTNKFWTEEEISSLRLLAKVFAVQTSKELDRIKHYDELYIDPITDASNYKKWYNDVNTIILEKPNLEYSILQISIADFHNIRSLIGSKQCEQIYCDIIDKLSTYIFSNILYCHDFDDKFMIFIPRTDKKEITYIFNEVSNHVLNNSPINRFKIILHGGVFVNDSNVPLNKAIDRVAIALKNNTNQLLTFFSNAILEAEQEKVKLELHMRDALKENEFLLYLQPKINSDTNELVGAEALTRWNYYHKKLIFPNVFIPLFEENGFIEELDFAVFENACRFQKSIIDENKTPVPISLNVSRYVSDFKEYLWRINRIKKKYNIPDNLIEIEITEGMFYNNDDIISDFIDLLHNYGYKVSMDDFGSGYSNLSSLSTLNFDFIKLDKSLAHNDSEKHQIILSYLIMMIKKLNMRIVCEGVETQEYADFLKTVGCYIIQGYLYDKPLPEAEFKKKYIK